MECIQQDKNVKCNYDEYDILMDKYNQTERILNDKCKDYSYDNCIKGVSGTQDTHELNEDIKIDSIGNRNISIMDNSRNISIMNILSTDNGTKGDYDKDIIKSSEDISWYGWY
eukprot:53497_1